MNETQAQCNINTSAANARENFETSLRRQFSNAMRQSDNLLAALNMLDADKEFAEKLAKFQDLLGYY